MKVFKSYIKMEKTIIKFSDIETQKQKFYQHEGPISTKNVDIDKVIVSNKVPFDKKGFKYFIDYKDAKKINLYVYLSPKWLHIEKTFTKLNIYIF